MPLDLKAIKERLDALTPEELEARIERAVKAATWDGWEGLEDDTVIVGSFAHASASVHVITDEDKPMDWREWTAPDGWLHPEDCSCGAPVRPDPKHHQPLSGFCLRTGDKWFYCQGPEAWLSGVKTPGRLAEHMQRVWSYDPASRPVVPYIYEDPEDMQGGG